MKVNVRCSLVSVCQSVVFAILKGDTHIVTFNTVIFNRLIINTYITYRPWLCYGVLYFV